jgi:formate dehydrogenase maturation protein FdhE
MKMISTSRSLLHCPFCGHRPISVWQGDSTPGMEDCGYWAVECVNCKGGRFCGVHGNDQAEAEQLWNQRFSLQSEIEEKYPRVIKSTDSHCPSCGHNRDASAISSIDNDDGTHYCQKCSAEWREVP